MTAPIDAVLIVAVALVGAGALVLPDRTLGLSKITLVQAAAFALVVIGGLEVYYMLDLNFEVGELGIGLWLLLVGGGVTLVAGFAGRNRPA